MTRITGQAARDLLGGTTEGPWEVERDECRDIIAQPGGHAVAYNEDDPDVGSGNSRLLAAAPDLAETVAWMYGREPDGPCLDEGAEWHTPNNSVVWTVPGCRVMVQRIEPGDLTPDEAEDLARALLAAAEKAREART